MAQVSPSPELNSRKDPPQADSCLADLTVNPWSMAIDDTSGQQTDGEKSGGRSLCLRRRDDSDHDTDVDVPGRWTNGGESRGRSLRHPRRDDSDHDDEPMTGDGKSKSAAEWIRSKVRVKEADYSSELRQYLRQSEGALAEAVRKNEELATMNSHLQKVYEEQKGALETFQRDVEQWTQTVETRRMTMQNELRAQHEAIAVMKKEMQGECQKLGEEKARIRVQKENEVAAMRKRYEQERRKIQRNQPNSPAGSPDIVCDLAEGSITPVVTPRKEGRSSAQPMPRLPPKRPPNRGAKVSRRVTVIAELMDDDATADADAESNTEERGQPKQERNWADPEEYMKSMEAMMNRLLDERGFAKPTPRKQRASIRKARKLEDEKNDPNRSNHLEHVRNLFKEVYDVECDEDFGGYLSATVNQVKEFEAGGPGPDDEVPQWDMRGTETSAWNSSVSEILTEKLLAIFEEEPPRFPPKSREYWENAIGNKFSRIKAVWSKARPRMTDAGTIEDADEVEQRRIEDTEQRLKRIRVRERRANKYDRRLRIVKSIAEAKHETGAEDAETWTWLTDIVERLGLDGMSSDESAAEDNIYTVYRTKVMQWRRNMDKELEIIDTQQFVDADIYTPRGSKPVKRMRGAGNTLSTRRPVAKLPEVFYDRDWLESQPKKFRERIPEEKFLWYNILGCYYGRK